MSRVLVTNDDGYQSPGLHALAARLAAEGHEVVVVAPSTDMTGCGTSVGEARPGMQIPIEVHTDPALPGVEMLVLDRGPSMCVLAACFGAVGERPDVVVAGVNAGPNTGNIIQHSGTLGAVLTAQHLGVSGLAVSLDYGRGWDWAPACEMASAALEWLHGAPAGTVLNVNVPNRPSAEVAGVRYADVVGAIGDLRFTRPDGGDWLVMEYRPALADGCDTALLHAGFVTVTELRGACAAAGVDSSALVEGVAAALQRA